LPISKNLAKPTHRYYEIHMQLKLIAGTWAKKRFAFGGVLLKGSHPKTKRPFRHTLAIHVVMKSTVASGPDSFFAHNKAIGQIVEKQASKQFVKIYGVANAGNHLHLLVQAPSQDHLSHFLRAISGRIAQLVKQKRHTDFWDARPFSRLVSWGRDFRSVARYLGANALESLGMARIEVHHMYEAIHRALKEGNLIRSPGLVAAGFG
jgi:REP element-mobilizing transposase RayT